MAKTLTLLQQLTSYIAASYGDKPEFLWEDFNSAVWRNQRNQKWYAIVQHVNRSKLGITDEPDDKIPILNVRLTPEEVLVLSDNKHFFPGYHMNKRYWLTIRLDGTVDFSQITELLDESYQIIDQKA